MLLLLVLLLPALAFAQEQTPTFRTGVTSVLVDTLALDSDGNPVPDLTVDDFEIYEDDVRQTIQSFDVTDWTSYVAAKTSDATPSSGGSSFNTYPRRFIFIFNRQGAQFEWLVRAKRALTKFVVESMAEGDEAMVIDVGFSTKVTQELQASKEQTLETIRQLTPMATDYPMGAGRAAGFLYQNLEALGNDLAAIPGRKVIVLLSNELLTFTGPGSLRSNEGFTLKAAIESLNQANTSVYTIDLRGPYSRPVQAGGLSPLATETGGRYFPNAIHFETPLRRIARENQRYYLMSYVPTNPEADGTYRRIEVRTTRPGVELIARQGYFARAPETVTDSSEEEDAAERAPAPSFAIPAAVEMMSYFLPTGTGTARVPLSVALPRDLLAADDRSLTVTISQDDATLHTFEENVNTSHYYLVENVELEPGSYLMQITLRADGEQLYQASTAIHVPAGFGERFGLSSVVPVIGPEGAAEVDGTVPLLPTPTLPRGSDAFLLFQVFPGRERPSRRAYLTYTIYDGDNEVGAGGKDGPLELAQDQPGGTPIVLRIPMSELRPGTYRIDIRAEDRSLGRRAASEIELRIK